MLLLHLSGESMSNNASVSVSRYPTIELIANRARTIVNDAFTSRSGVPGGGRILTDNSASLIPYFNGALEEVQQRLRNNSVQLFTIDNAILTPITPVTQIDPSVQVALTSTGYFNGTTQSPTPQLPNDLIVPMKLWSRPTGSALPFKEMTQPQEGLLSYNQGPYLTTWEWRDDGIYMNGATESNDIRIRYQKGLPYITGKENFKTTVIPIQGCVEVVAYLIARQYALSRGAQDVTGLDAQAEKFMRLLINQYVRQRQSVEYRRPPYGQGQRNRSRSTYGW